MTQLEENTETPVVTRTAWQKKTVPTDMWESTLTVQNGYSLKVSVFGAKHKMAINTQSVILTAIGVQETLHLWREQIIQDVVALSSEFKEAELRESLKLVNVLFDSEHKLSAIFLDTPILHGHQVVVEFNSFGEPYEAEITG